MSKLAPSDSRLGTKATGSSPPTPPSAVVASISSSASARVQPASLIISRIASSRSSGSAVALPAAASAHGAAGRE
eukprot:2857450-Prymnesium_polylepis.1